MYFHYFVIQSIVKGTHVDCLSHVYMEGQIEFSEQSLLSR